jgi:hypothetical protein
MNQDNRRLSIIITCFGLGLGLVAAGCGSHSASPPDDHPAFDREAVLSSNALISNALISNALISNALISNALISNALISNALISNALISNALSSDGLSPDGVNTDGALARQFLSYAYSCAMGPNDSLTVDIKGQPFTVHGALNLAPEWGKEGGQCDGRCQRWLTACLLSRTNYWGVPVKISLRGNRPELFPTDAEQKAYPLREGTYFGNLFQQGQTRQLWGCAGPASNVPQLSNRMCSAGGSACQIAVRMDCLDPEANLRRTSNNQGAIISTRYACRRQDPNSGALLDCYTGGVSIYGDDPRGDFFSEAITVYVQQPVAICGDGVCTGDESAATCAADCSKGWAAGARGLYNVPVGAGTLPGGDFYFAVAAIGPVDLGAGPVKALRGESDVVLARYSAQGKPLWSRAIAVGSVGLAAADSSIYFQADAAGNFYGAAHLSSDAWIDEQPFSLTDEQSMSDDKASVLIKLDPNGDLLWSQQVSGGTTSFALTPDGAPIVTLRAPSPNPEQRWQQILLTFSADGQSNTAVYLDNMAQSLVIILAVEPNGDLLVHEDGQDQALFRFRRAALALEPVGPTGPVTAASVGPGGDIFTVGPAPQPDGTYTVLLRRLTHDGAEVWSKALLGPAHGVLEGDHPLAVPVGVSVNQRGDIVVTGRFPTPVDFENDVLTPNANVSGALEYFQDVFVARYGSDGHKVWVKKLGGLGDDIPINNNVLAEDGSLLVCGSFSETGVFDGRILENPSGGGESSTYNSFVVSIPADETK